jgi:3-deoxy-manno-octulosonate cytidylyltransferase (CMP-KDO synthetase)
MIPARYGSGRFEGKPLAPIAGTTLLQRTYESALKCQSFDSLIVATDDKRIFDHVKNFRGEVVMTSTQCATGTDRVIEALKNFPRHSDQDIVVIVQGDVPCIEAEVIQQVIDILKYDSLAVASTAVIPLISEEEAYNPSVVKCVVDRQQNALYFSRALIPHGHKGKFNPKIPYYHHVGLYAYRYDFLMNHLASLPQTPLQLAEDLEQLKVLENGYRMKVAIVNSHSIGVDTPEDIKKVEELLCKKQNTFSSQAASVPL